MAPKIASTVSVKTMAHTTNRMVSAADMKKIAGLVFIPSLPASFANMPTAFWFPGFSSGVGDPHHRPFSVG